MPRESIASKRGRAQAIDAALGETYPLSTCALRHENPFQLLVATVLSAQTTDLAVNQVTPGLFADYPTPEAMADAPDGAIESHINSIGLWRNKAKSLRGLCRMLVEEFDGRLPTTVTEMTRLPGVGKKTATAVLGTAMGVTAGVTVDTHMLRINRLLGLSKQTDADKMAAELERLLPDSSWSAYTHRIIDHGRLVCVARRPRCGACVLAARELCPSAFDATAGYKPQNDESEPASARGLSWLVAQAQS